MKLTINLLFNSDIWKEITGKHERDLLRIKQLIMKKQHMKINVFLSAHICYKG